MHYDILPFLVASRICHDLINPIGATHNGIELLALDPKGPSGLEIELIQSSVDDARARIEYFRFAFGMPKLGMKVETAQLASLARQIFDRKKYTLIWEIDFPVERVEGQYILLSLMCLERQMPFGAEITIQRGKITAKACKPRDVIDQWAILTQGTEPDTTIARDVEFLMLRHILDQTGMDVSVTTSAQKIMICAKSLPNS